MPTLKELKQMATQRKIKGRSKMNKAQLEAALGIKVKSRKSIVKKSRKARIKKSRKARIKKSRKARVKKSRKARVKKSRKARVKKSRKSRVKKSRKSVKKSRKSRVKSVSQKSLKNNKSSQALLELTWGISELNKLLRAREKALSETKVILEEAKSKFNSPNFKSLSAFAQTRIKQDVAYYTGLVIDKEKEIKGLYILRDESIKVHERMKEIESLLGHRLTVREIHKLRHLISQLEPKDQKEYRDRMQDSLRRFRMGDEKACPICLEKITEKEIASDKVIGCTFSNATKAEQERYLKEKGINSTGRSAIIKFFGNCCSKAKKVRTTCGEHYHIDCIRGWNKDTCPTCRRPVSGDTRKKLNPHLRKPRAGGWGKALKAGLVGLAAGTGGAAVGAAVKDAWKTAEQNRAEIDYGGYASLNDLYSGSATLCNAFGTSREANWPPCPIGEEGPGGFPLTQCHHVPGQSESVCWTPVEDGYSGKLGLNAANPSQPDVCSVIGTTNLCQDPNSAAVRQNLDCDSCSLGEIYQKHLAKETAKRAITGIQQTEEQSTVDHSPPLESSILPATAAAAAALYTAGNVYRK